MGLIRIISRFSIRISKKRSERESSVSELDDESDNTNDVLYYKKLYQAAREGNWEVASVFFGEDPDAMLAKITKDNEMALHIAVGAGHRNGFLKNLIDMMPEDTLGLTDGNNETALSIAAIVGNTEAAKMLVEKNKYLPYIWSGRTSPLHRAAQYGHREIVSFLLEKTKPNIGRSPYADVRGVLLVELLSVSRLYDLALQVLQDHPIILEAMSLYKNHSPLMALANQPSSFLSGTSFNLWHRLLYNCIPSPKSEIGNKIEENQNQRDDEVDTKLSCCNKFGSGFRNAYEVLLRTFSEALYIKQLRDKKKMHQNVKDIVKYICVGVSHLGHEEAEQLFKDPFFLAATWGIKEIVDEIIRDFPSAIWFTRDGHSVFHLAVLNRRGEIFSLIYNNKSDVKQIIRKHIDRDENNLLHLAARLAPSHRLSLISGAVLQMQNELQWFKKVEKFVAVHYKESMNKEGKTPEMVFIEEHKSLIKEAENWMNKTAGACSTAATLIATVVFAAAITVPGGNNSAGSPVLLQRRTFKIFAISDAVALFSSTASLLMFLAILTSRYSHKDFLTTLPRKLIIGLLTLSISVASLMVAFSTTLYLVIGQGRKSFLLGLGVVGGVVVMLFALMFSSLIGKMIWSTYGTTTTSYKCRPLRRLIELIW